MSNVKVSLIDCPMSMLDGPTIIFENDIPIWSDSSTKSLLLPKGTTAERPLSAVNGYIRYNTQNHIFEGVKNGSWVDISLSTASFSTLSDVSGPLQANKYIRVNSTGTQLEYVDITITGGDMTKAVYDPSNKQADAFNMENMTNGSTKYYMTLAEKNKLSTVSNNADQTTSTNVASVMNSVGTKTFINDPDIFSLLDNSDGNSLKKATWLVLKNTLKTYFDTLYSTANIDFALTSEILAGVSNTKALNVVNTWDSIKYTELVNNPTIAVDFAGGVNFRITLNGNRTLGAPSNVKSGQSGIILIKQDGTGGRTLSYNSVYKFQGAVPSVTTASNSVSILCYSVEDASNIRCTLITA